jgi:hypothetical protein
VTAIGNVSVTAELVAVTVMVEVVLGFAELPQPVT